MPVGTGIQRVVRYSYFNLQNAIIGRWDTWNALQPLVFEKVANKADACGFCPVAIRCDLCRYAECLSWNGHKGMALIGTETIHRDIQFRIPRERNRSIQHIAFVAEPTEK